MNAQNRQLDYKIDRRPGRSISLRVSPQGILIVKAPRMVSKRQIDNFILKKRAWVERQRASHQDLYGFGPNSLIAPGLRIVITSGANLTAKLSATGQIQVHKPESATNWEVYSEIRPLLKQRLNQLARPKLEQSLNSVAKRGRRKPKTLRVRFMRTRWGSCTSDGKISLNSQLIRLPEELIEYVAAHELAHLKVSNHSPIFYDHLSNYVPEPKKLQRALRSYKLFY